MTTIWSDSKIEKKLTQKDWCSLCPELTMYGEMQRPCFLAVQLDHANSHVCYSAGRSFTMQVWDSCVAAQQNNYSFVIYTTGKFSIYTVFGMRIAQEITLRHMCVWPGTGSSCRVLTGLYIQQSSWMHMGIFCPPVAAEITYYCHPISQRWSHCMFTLQFISSCFFACLVLTSRRPWYPCDIWCFQPSNSSGDNSPP